MQATFSISQTTVQAQIDVPAGVVVSGDFAVTNAVVSATISKGNTTVAAEIDLPSPVEAVAYVTTGGLRAVTLTLAEYLDLPVPEQLDPGKIFVIPKVI